ncbi:MAG: 3-phosphoshikimate 1-carboxyvinyltransferase [Bacillales bacterium]|jgi:3-phosphoshikimate 1-carboxyvinyltransferase|nr:3-phosphoshikimate 1-carboxyvinyltransferase [Bacillales bacterium]
MKLDFTNRSLNCDIEVPGDKSISHRAIMFGAIAHGDTHIKGFLYSEDCKSTLSCFRQLGVEIKELENEIIVHGKGIQGLKKPLEHLDVGNSGTTIRLMSGLLAGSAISATLFGDASIAKRPMARVIKPLSEMGANIKGSIDGNYAPIKVTGTQLKGITYKMPIASAQVKSAILLAGIHAEGETRVIEPNPSRDHTERFLRAFGGAIFTENNEIVIKGNQQLHGQLLHIPGDISSAAFWMVAAAITPGSEVKLLKVGLNPTRTGIIDVMKEMGSDIEIEELESTGEPYGNIIVRYSNLRGTVIDGELITRLIDEIPIIALLATQALGQTTIRNAEELRVKETDRIAATSEQLSLLGANIIPTKDGLIIKGGSKLFGAEVDSCGDHRIGMMLAVSALVTDGPVILNNADAIAVSYPTFINDLNKNLC